MVLGAASKSVPGAVQVALVKRMVAAPASQEPEAQPGVLGAAAWTGTEEERELGGLLLVGLWMLVLTVYHRRHERHANA